MYIMVPLPGTHLMWSASLKHHRPLATLVEIFSQYLHVYLPFLLIKGSFLHLILFWAWYVNGHFPGI